MAKKFIKSRKRREQTIAIIIVAAVVLLITAGLLIWVASKNENIGEHDHDHENWVEAEVTLRVGMSYEEGDTHYASVKAFKDEVESRTSGAVRVEILSSDKTVLDESMISEIASQKDTVDIVVSNVSNFTGIDARMDISSLPFLFDGYESAWKFMDGEIQKEIEKDLIKRNIRVLAYYSDGFEAMTTTKDVISNGENVKNKNFAMSEESSSAITLHAMNARTVVLGSNAIVQALQNGTCHGYVGTIESIYSTRAYQVQKYMSLTYHTYDAIAFAISEEVWQRLSEDQQNAVSYAAQNSSFTDRQNVRQQEEAIVQKIESAGVQIIHPKRTSFYESANAVMRGLRDTYGSLIDRVLLK